MKPLLDPLDVEFKGLDLLRIFLRVEFDMCLREMIRLRKRLWNNSFLV